MQQEVGSKICLVDWVMSKSPSSSLSSKELGLDCSICLELLEEPVTPQCGHSLCKACLAKISKPDPSAPGAKCAECPTCRKKCATAGLEVSIQLRA